MCRFVLYLGPAIRVASLVTEPAHSLIRQSVHSNERREPLNGDGFGVAWYARDLQPEPAAFRAVTPAWNNANLIDLARVVESDVILAHVRAASPGSVVSEVNCHPFRSGRFAFMHNGDVREFLRVKRPLLDRLSDAAFAEVRGSTDSEHLFALFVDAVARMGSGDPLSLMADGLRDALKTIIALQAEHNAARPVYANVAVSDGLRAVACRFTSDAPGKADSLYVHTGMRYECREGACAMVRPDDGLGAVIVASEALSSDPGWDEVPEGSMLLIDEQRRVKLEPVGV
ncbi:MAG: class II glutamine amidotransferase [Planctomycetes bacterium]|nr:class II glutamine amidotransferase [Planctomycetota bacterium]